MKRKRSWRSTLAGVLMLFAGLASIYNNPKNIEDPQTFGLIAGGAGLIAAQDDVKNDEEKQ